jgi:pyruvate dehydrogenase E1 component beta subunit
MFWSFYSVAWDQIASNAAMVRYMSGGLANCPIVIRGPANGGTGVGATHSHTPENIMATIPGLKVVVASTAADAKGLMKTAIRDNDPVMFMENTLLYGVKGSVPDPADGDFTIPLGVADLKREGSDLSIISYGRSVLIALEAAHKLSEEHGIECDVLDLRSIRPLDAEAIYATVRKTNRVVLVEENKPFCGVMAQITSMIQEQCFDDLDAPIQRVSSLDAPAIYSPGLELSHQLPTAERVIEKVLAIS